MKNVGVLVREDGEEFFYSSSFDDESYYYEVSLEIDEKDCNLFISRWGCHIEFSDGSWLDFNISPDQYFPNRKQLSSENLLAYLSILSERYEEGIEISSATVNQHYINYKNKIDQS